jgi:hypothetical protein
MADPQRLGIPRLGPCGLMDDHEIAAAHNSSPKSKRRYRLVQSVEHGCSTDGARLI